jgi:hypothetical protein
MEISEPLDARAAQPLGIDVRVAGGCCDALTAQEGPGRRAGWLRARLVGAWLHALGDERK